MTNAQLKLAEVRETQRSNKEREKETNRSNLAKEKETARSNKANEALTKRGQNYKLGTDVAKAVTSGLGTIAGIANDPTFYTKDNAALIAATVPTNFNVPVGLPIAPYSAETLPGVTTIVVQNSIPIADGNYSDVINKMAQMLFTAIQAHTNYTKTYQSADLAIMLLAQREMLALIHHAAKILRIAKTFSTENKYYGDMVLRSLNIDVDDLRTNYANYKKELLLLIESASQLFIPDIPLMHRTTQLFGSWFRDECPKGNEMRTMTYLFKPHSFGIYDVDADTSVGGIHYLPFGWFEQEDATIWDSLSSNVYPFRDLLSALQHQIDYIIGDDNFRFISGDLARTFTKFFSPASVDIDSAQVPAYDEYSLAQIHNLSTLPNIGSNIFGTGFQFNPWVAPGSLTENGIDIRQDADASGNLIYHPMFSIGSGLAPNWNSNLEVSSRIITEGCEVETAVTKPSTDYVIDATRLSVGTWIQGVAPAAIGEPINFSALVVSCGTEIPLAYQVWEINSDGSGESFFPTNLATTALSLTEKANTIASRDNVVIYGANELCTSPNGAILKQLHPITGHIEDGVYACARSGQIRNLRYFDKNTMRYMHYAAAMSLFGITSLFKELLAVK